MNLITIEMLGVLWYALAVWSQMVLFWNPEIQETRPPLVLKGLEKGIVCEE